MGKTGKRFDENIGKILSSIEKIDIKNNDYDIILINAVPYQCSEGKTLSKYKNKIKRDNNWIEYITQEENKEDLKRRIELLHPKYVINLCTIGIKNLQLMLQNIICDNMQRYKYGYGSHPSTWWLECRKFIIMGK